jgi:hypothetical protein
VASARLSVDINYSLEDTGDTDARVYYWIRVQKPVSKTWTTLHSQVVSNATYTYPGNSTFNRWYEPITNYSIANPETIFNENGMYNFTIDVHLDTTLSDDWTKLSFDNIELYIGEVAVTLTLGNVTNVTQDWGKPFNLNHSVTSTSADAANVNVTYNLSWIANNNTMGTITTDTTKWHNQTLLNYTVQNVTVQVNANTTSPFATNDSKTFWINITKRTASSTMDSPSTQIVKTSETFYINATVIDEYNENYVGNADLLNDSGFVSTLPVANNAVNFSRNETTDGTYNFSVIFYNTTHYFNTTTPTNSTVTVDGTPPVITIDVPTTSLPIYRIGGEEFWVNFTYTESNPANYTVNIFNSTAVINTTTVNYPTVGTDQVANESFYLNTSAADGCYNVSVGMYDNASNYFISYQNNSVVKDDTPPTITINEPTTSSPIYRESGELFYVNFTYTEQSPANYTVNIYNSTAAINTTTVNYPVSGINQVANVSFYLNSSAADGQYNVSVLMYGNDSNYFISYQNNSVVKDEEVPTITIEEPTTSSQIYRIGGEEFWVNFTYTELNPANYTVNIFNSTAVINTTTVNYPTCGVNQVANVSFYLNPIAADGWYNVSVEMYDNCSNYGISYQNNSVVKDSTNPTITIDEPTTSSPVYKNSGEHYWVNFTYTELNPANYTVNIHNSTAVINTTTVNYPVGGINQVVNESFYLNSSAADGWYNVSVEMYDNSSNYGISYQNKSVAKGDIPPTISTPPDKTVILDSVSYITWNVTDNNPKNYWVLRNGVQVVPPTVYTSGVDFNVQIDTSTLGVWNYTIFANDTTGNVEADKVIITVSIRSLALPEFNIIGLIALICTLSITLAVSIFIKKD